MSGFALKSQMQIPHPRRHRRSIYKEKFALKLYEMYRSRKKTYVSIPSPLIRIGIDLQKKILW